MKVNRDAKIRVIIILQNMAYMLHIRKLNILT